MQHYTRPIFKSSDARYACIVSFLELWCKLFAKYNPEEVFDLNKVVNVTSVHYYI